jgi:FkbM family methyltransferase
MNTIIKKLVRSMIRPLGLEVVRQSSLQRLQENSQAAGYLELLLQTPDRNAGAFLSSMRESKSQLGQDLFALSQVDFKREGFFVEFGGASGVELSNSYLLEKSYGWKGIIAEPAVNWHKSLREHRNCHIETDCIWKDTGSTLVFREAEEGEYSTISNFVFSDVHRSRRSGKTYSVRTISLADALAKYEAPRVIDYLSIDTEGSEYDILQSFDFSMYRFRVITCEHNFTEKREMIHALLAKNGYVRKLEHLSQFDDWYVSAEV